MPVSSASDNQSGFGALTGHAAAYLNAAPDAIVVVDGSGVITLVNRQAELLFGYERDELVGELIELLVPQEVKTIHGAHRTRYRAAPRVRQMGDAGSRLRARRSDGSLVPVEVALSPVEIDGVVSTMTVVRDVTSRVEAEAAHDLIRQSLDAVDDGVFMFDAKSLEFTYVNSGAAAQVKYSVEELCDGMTPLHLKPLFTEASFRELLRPLVDEQVRSASIDTIHRRKDGIDVPVEIVMQYPQTPDASQRLVVALVRDVTRRVQAEAARERREELRRTLAEIRMAAMEEQPVEQIAELITERALELLEASHASLAHTVSGNQLHFEAVTGTADAHVVGVLAPTNSAIESVLEQGEPSALDQTGLAPWLPSELAAKVGPLGPSMIVPVIGPNGPEGILTIARSEGGPLFDEPDLEIALALASEVATARKLNQARSDRRSRSLAEDRERIARDLHDHVIQRMFATGMRLQAALGSPDLLAERCRDSITELDGTIEVIRESIFQLTNPDLSLSGELDRLLDRHRAVGRAVIDSSIDGDLGSVPEYVGDQLVASLNELLSNVARHSDAEEVKVTIAIGDTLDLTVDDDGVGIGSGRRSGGLGLRNLRKRAEVLGGDITLEPAPEGGTHAFWSVPLNNQVRS